MTGETVEIRRNARNLGPYAQRNNAMKCLAEYGSEILPDKADC
ncbi:hypothetical protein BN2476_210008 [Paraburkholderia piptadeniae]|uniref:Uncharacterized protein n=1 Tax=Paraburkholderia piptadeniae TaxID=1701573 RepID=A0A1N7RVC4_9BURK|nr:hypothetical protein BN2476_210008 [Paraburkholderia piptadeniae]